MMGIDEDLTAKIRELQSKLKAIQIGDPTSILKDIVEILAMMDEVKTVKRKYYGKAR